MEPVDGSKKYSLRWEKHAFNLATEAGCFFEDESFLDCTLSAEGQCIDAHKIILSASSSYLSSLLKLMPDKHPILIFNDMKFEQLKSLVAFIYNGTVNISENDIHAFLNAAQSLLIKGLYEEEPKSMAKTLDHVKKSKKGTDVFDVRKNNHRVYERIPPLRKTDAYQDVGKLAKKERLGLTSKGGGVGPAGNSECEDSLCKLQEISFTKYIHQNLNSKPVNSRGSEDKWSDAFEERPRVSENYIVRSWKHSSMDDLNGRHKQSKVHFFKKLKLEKTEAIPHNDETGNRLCSEQETEGKRNQLDESILEDEMKKEDDLDPDFLVEPKQEILEEDDTNSDMLYSKTAGGKDQNSCGGDTCNSESDSGFDNHRQVSSSYFHRSAVEAGIPVPLLICKASLSEPDNMDSNWMPKLNNSSIPTDHSMGQAPSHNDAIQDLQCRTCTQDLPCPTCTKKYKSRYALNRHILYECGKARKSFSCDECGKKVTRQDTLQKHKLIHLVQHLKDKESESEVTEATKAKKKC